MNAQQYLSQHVRNIDTELAKMRQQAAAYTQEAAKLSQTAAELQVERDKAQGALEALQTPKRSKKKEPVSG